MERVPPVSVVWRTGSHLNHIFPIPLRRELGILAFFCAVGLAIRLPYFFPAVINWDESTFIIVGQSTVDGYLPYEIAWDVKPTFVFWWFGAAIELFGKTIPALRVAGFIWLILSAYLLYRAALSMTHSRLGGVFAAAMLIVASSAYSQHVSTEHLAALPIAGAILVLCDGGRRSRSVFLAGTLLGLSCMFRLNLIYLCLIVGVFLCIQVPRGSWRAFLYGRLRIGIWFLTGLLVPILLSFLPYLLSAHSGLWIEFYEAAVRFSGEPQFLVRNIVETLRKSFEDLVGATMWGAAILGAFIICRHWRDLKLNSRSNWLLCGAFVLGTIVSIAMTHTEEVPIYRHYFTQLVPGLSMFAAALFMWDNTKFGSTKAKRATFTFGIAVIVLVIFRTTAAEWRALTQRVWAGGPLSYGIEYEIADLIRSQTTEDYSLFMMDHHLVYWFLGRYPLTRLATHPSNISKRAIREYLEPDSATTEDALRSVLQREPTFIVWRPNLFYLEAADVRFLQQELTKDYALIGQIGPTQVYRRIGLEPRHKSGWDEPDNAGPDPPPSPAPATPPAQSSPSAPR